MPSERPPKVFISYSHDSPEHEERVLNLANRLRGDRIDATIDRYETSPREGWPVWMEKQIRESDFVLVVCTPPYLGRAERREKEGVGKGAIWETALTLQALYEASANNERFIPIVFNKENVADIPMPLRSATYYLLINEDGYQRLLRRLHKQSEVKKPEIGTPAYVPGFNAEGATASPAKAQSKTLWNVPHSRNDAFTGREQILSDLRADLVKKGKQALSGLGGVGKTQIAVEYAYRHKDEYTAVLWTFSDTEQSVRSGFGQIASLLNLPEKNATEQAKITEAVRRWLEENTGWLLVLDNADDPGVLKPFLPQQAKGHVLLTSRAHEFQKVGIFSPREANVLTGDEAREFLLLRTGKDPTTKSLEADALAKELGYLPLALEQAAAYIVEMSAGFTSYLASFKKQRTRLLAKQGPVFGNEALRQQKRTVATTWAVNFDDIQKNAPASAELLRLSAFLAPDTIPLELLEKGQQQLSVALGAKLVEAKDDPLVLDELQKPLLRYSLIRRNEESRSYSIHPIVQEVVREGLTNEEKRAWAERAVRTVGTAFPDPREFENWPECDRLLAQALACDRFINSFDLQSAEADRLLTKAAYYLEERAEFAQAEPLYLCALEISKKTLGQEHPDTAASLNNLAELYRKQGRHKEAGPLQRRALEIREKSLGPEHPDTAASLNNLALLYCEQGKYDEAEPFLQRAMAIMEKALGPEHLDTAQILNNLAELYCNQGREKEAEPLHCRVLEIREKALGSAHPDTAESLNNLAALYYQQGKYDQAEPQLRRALEITEKVLGPEHPITGTSLNNLAELYSRQGRGKEAEPMYRRSLGIRQRTLGLEHPVTATSLNNLAGFLNNQGKHTEAETMYQSALTIMTKTLGPEHPHTGVVRNQLIRFYRELGRNQQAEALEKRAKDKAE